MLMMCIKLCNLRINCSVLMSVILFVFLLLHILMPNICLVECQLMLTNDLELTRFDDTHYQNWMEPEPDIQYIPRGSSNQQ